MLRAGASLPQVGQVLRHRSDLSTAIYAKVDENALRPLARPWPTRRWVMTGLRRAAEDYLAMRRALGFKLTTQGSQLMSFVAYCESRGSDRIASDLALEWATTTRSGSTHDGYLARRLTSVRIFARHYQTLDPDSEIPPEDALPHHKCRITPYLYAPGEIAALIDAAAQLTPPLRAATWQTLIGLLAVTGMRKGEACRLDEDHVDLDAATLVAPGLEVRQVAAAVPAPDHGHRAARLCRPA